MVIFQKFTLCCIAFTQAGLIIREPSKAIQAPEIQINELIFLMMKAASDVSKFETNGQSHQRNSHIYGYINLSS